MEHLTEGGMESVILTPHPGGSQIQASQQLPITDVSWWRGWIQLQGEDPRPADPFVEEWAPRLAEVLTRDLPRQVVELGAGNGIEAEVFRRWGWKVIAVDMVGVGLVDFGQRPGAQVLEVDLRSPLPLPDHCAGVVYSRNVLSGDFSDAELASLLGEVRRILSPGGLFLLQVRATADPTYQRLGEPGPVRINCGGVGLRFFSRKSLLRWLHDYCPVTLELRQEPGHEGEAQWLCAAWRPTS